MEMVIRLGCIEGWHIKDIDQQGILIIIP